MSLGSAEALIVNTTQRGPNQLRGPDEKALGSTADDAVSTFDRLTGGALSDLQTELATVKMYLQISIAASVLSGVFALWAALRKRA